MILMLFILLAQVVAVSLPILLVLWLANRDMR